MTDTKSAAESLEENPAESPPETLGPTPETLGLTPETLGLTPEAVREVLAACSAHESPEEALDALNTLLPHLAEVELVREWRAACDVVLSKAVAQSDPSGVMHAHITIFLGSLVSLGLAGEEMAWADGMFLLWLRHPKSFGQGHQTPREFQKPEMVQWLADLVGWRKLDPGLSADREAIGGFLAWVNTWSTGNKRKILRTLDTLRRMHPDRGLWDRVGFRQ